MLCYVMLCYVMSCYVTVRQYTRLRVIGSGRHSSGGVGGYHGIKVEVPGKV